MKEWKLVTENGNALLYVSADTKAEALERILRDIRDAIIDGDWKIIDTTEEEGGTKS